MITKQKMEKVLKLMTNRYEDNVSILAKELNKHNVSKNNVLFVLTDDVYDEKLCYIALESLLSSNQYSVNATDAYKYNFIQNAIYDGYSSGFVLKVIELSSRYGLNVNHQDDDGDTILHTAIYADDFKGDIVEIYKALIKCGFDSRIKDKANRTVVEAMRYEKERHAKFSDKEIKEVEKLYNSEISRINAQNKVVSELDKVLEMMGYDLTVNKNILNRELPKLGVKKDKYLFKLTDELHNELSCFAAIKAILPSGTCRVNEKDGVGYNFIQNAMYAGYSTAFINGCIDACNDNSITYKLDVNHRDDDGDTMLHSAIYCNDKCVLNIASVYSTLLKYGFDSRLKDNDGRSIIDAMKYEKKRCNKFSDEEIKEVERIYNSKLGIEDASFSEEELNQNKRLNEEGLASFLKKCKR